MKYCVIKNTTTIIDGSNNSEEIMLENVVASGLKVEDIEILTEEEYQIKLNQNIDIVKQEKIREINQICGYKIINEFYSNCLGEKKRFDCTRDDQTYIMGLASKAQLILNGIATDKNLDWKSSGEPICYPWTPQQALILGQDLFNHLTEKKKRYEQIKEYILTNLTTVEAVKAVTWDIVIPS